MKRLFSLNFYRKQFYRLLKWAEHHMLGLLFVFALLVGSLIVLWPKVFIKIPAGSVGVIYRPLSGGVDLQDLYREGFFLIWPWNQVTVYTTRVQLKELSLELLTSDLLPTQVKVGFQFELNPLTVPMLHKYVGEGYLQTLIVPQIISMARKQVAQFSSKMAYTADISTVAEEIAITADNVIIDKLSPPGLSNVRLVRVSSVQLLEVVFPPNVQQAIQNKVVEAEIADAYKFKIQAASQEAVRKKIEATGVRDFQVIVNENMTQDYLIYRGIQATEQLAQSPNSKTLIFGSGPTGLPLLLGNALENNPPGLAGSAVNSSSIEAGPLEPASQMANPLEPSTAATTSPTSKSMTSKTTSPMMATDPTTTVRRTAPEPAPVAQTPSDTSTTASGNAVGGATDGVTGAPIEPASGDSSSNAKSNPGSEPKVNPR